MKQYHKKISNKRGVTLLEIMIGFAIGVIATVVLLAGISYVSMTTARTSVYQRAAHINAAVVTEELATHSNNHDFEQPATNSSGPVPVDVLQLRSTDGRYAVPFGFITSKREVGEVPAGVGGGSLDSLQGLSLEQTDMADEANSDNRSVMLCKKPSSNFDGDLRRGIYYQHNTSTGGYSYITESPVWCHKKSNGEYEEVTDVYYNGNKGGKLDWGSIERRPSNGQDKSSSNSTPADS